ncbi:MAG: hypothetical protein PHO29_05890 [Acetobacterium sp.]|nr:hypothetical protein [Acetobacterium sp.]
MIKMIKSRQNQIIFQLCTILVIVAMVMAAELTGENEIIFPEVAALAIGSFLTPKLFWKTSYIRMILSIQLCAIFGVLIVRFVPFPLWTQVAIAYAIGQVIFLCSRTTLAPMISAIVLPVLLQTDSVIYLISAFLLTTAIVCLRKLLEQRHLKEVNSYEIQPLPEKRTLIAAVFRVIFVALFAAVCLKLDLMFCLAPPLLVAFTELTNKKCPAGKRRFEVIILVTLCAMAGVICRYFIHMQLGFPLTVAALITTILIILLVQSFRLYFPPAGAMGILAMLISESAVSLYTLQVFTGISVLTVISLFWTVFDTARETIVSD